VSWIVFIEESAPMSHLCRIQAAHFHRMSAVPPKADMCSAKPDVRFGPKADIVASARQCRRPAGVVSMRLTFP
jgi:hypothetical protein